MRAGEPRDADSPIIDTEDDPLHDSLVVIVAVLSNESYTTVVESHLESAEQLQADAEDTLLVDMWCGVYSFDGDSIEAHKPIAPSRSASEQTTASFSQS